MINSKQIAHLRIAATVAVIVLHLAGAQARNLSGTPAWAAFNGMVRVLSFWAVPVFVLLSGYCLIGQDAPAMQFYRRRAARILLPLTAWSVVYLVFRALSPTGYELRELPYTLWRGDPYYHMWFLYMIAGIYLLTPWYLKLRRQWSLRGEIVVVALLNLASWMIAWPTRHIGWMQGWPILALEFFGLFAAAPLLSRLAVRPSARWIAFAVMLWDIACKIVLLRTGGWGWLDVDAVCFYRGPGAFISGGAIFVFALSFRDWTVSGGYWRAGVEALSRVTLGIYLLHTLVIWAESKVPGLFQPGLANYVAAIVIALAGSTVPCLVLSRIPYLRKLV